MKFLYLILLILVSKNLSAQSTNINKTNNEFADNIQGKENLDSEIYSIIESTKSSIGSGDVYEIFSPETIEINYDNIEPQGKEARSSEKLEHFNLLEVDYTKSGAIKHKQDIDEIVLQTNSRFTDLAELLRKNGIDCDNIKDYKEEMLSPFYIETKQIPNKEVKYKPNFCEQLKNSYNCFFSLRLNCLEKGVEWQEWQSRTITIPGHELVSSGYGLLYSHYVARNTFEHKLISPSSQEAKYNGVTFNSIPQMKLYLQNKLQSRKGSISNDMIFGWYGGIYPLGGKDYAWRNYTINYKYRDGDDICKKWSDEIWEESCSFG